MRLLVTYTGMTAPPSPLRPAPAGSVAIAHETPSREDHFASAQGGAAAIPVYAEAGFRPI